MYVVEMKQDGSLGKLDHIDPSITEWDEKAWLQAPSKETTKYWHIPTPELMRR
jgi:hypothetical protein